MLNKKDNFKKDFFRSKNKKENKKKFLKTQEVSALHKTKNNFICHHWDKNQEINSYKKLHQKN